MDNVGIDVHKHQSQICIVSETGEPLLERRVNTTRGSFEEVFAGRSKQRVSIEAEVAVSNAVIAAGVRAWFTE